MKNSPVRILVPLAITFVATTASAQVGWTDEWKPQAKEQRVGGRLGLWSARGSGTQLPLIGSFQYELKEELYLTAELPLTFSINGPGDKTRAGLGNPTAGVHFTQTPREDITWHVGGKLSLPLAAIDDDDMAIANSLAGAAWAAEDAYLFTPRYFPIGGVGGIEYRVTAPIYLRGWVSPTMYFPLNTKGGQAGLSPSNSFEFVLQTKVEAEARADAGYGGGGSLTMVSVLTDSSDPIQLALNFFGSYVFGPSFYARGGMVLALDTPFGFAFDKGKVWTFYAQANYLF